MLMRILTDNPGPSFTRNIDSSFVKTVKELLREGKDLSVQQILRETLDSFERDKKDNESLGPLMEMWKKEKAKGNVKLYGNAAGIANMYANRGYAPPGGGSQPGNHFARQHRQPRSLPPPDELAARIEEAKTTAKLLSQTVQSTPTLEILNNDLIKEFADRASSASRSIQGYIHSTNPAPDEDTLLTLIETNDQLSIAMSKHQRALLQARRAMGESPVQSPPPQSSQNNSTGYAPPLGPPPGAFGAVKTQDHAYPAPANPPPGNRRPLSPVSPQPASQTQSNTYGVAENPFTDDAYLQSIPPSQPQGLFDRPYNNSALQQPLQPKPLYPQSAQPNSYSTTTPATTTTMSDYQTTQSYANRQDSAANNVTMHGASPPPSSPPR